MKLQELDYKLPEALIAQFPASPRDHSKLMIIERNSGKITHEHFYDLPEILTSNDVLVFNETKVFPARIFGNKEILLLKNINNYTWELMTKPGAKSGEKIIFDGFECEIISRSGKVAIGKFNIPYLDLLKSLEKIGNTPLPPYIKSEVKSSDYQTVYAKNLGSAAAPTAGLHFTNELIQKLKDKNIQMEYVTLHVGLGTFEPVREENIGEHNIHEEYFEIEKETYKRLIEAKKKGKRIIAIGTTTTRVLETIGKKRSFDSAQDDISGMTNLYILPGFKFKIVDGLITNFHLPKSTLIALVMAFAGKGLTKKVYSEAIRNKYRFYSFGDASYFI